MVRLKGYNFGHVQVSTDPRQAAVFDVTLRGSRGFDSTTSWSFNPGIALKPSSNIFVQLSPSYDWSQGKQQYVLRQADPTATAFSGNRYVFGFVTTRTVSLETRVNWTMRPTVTLQLYAQPFFASGDYSAFSEFLAPRTDVQREYGKDVGTIARDPATSRYTVDPDGAGPAAPFTFDDPNFTSRSLRGTAVLRWEYRPGSTMFFVWTQQRAGSDAYGDFDFRRDTRVALRRSAGQRLPGQGDVLDRALVCLCHPERAERVEGSALSSAIHPARTKNGGSKGIRADEKDARATALLFGGPPRRVSRGAPSKAFVVARASLQSALIPLSPPFLMLVSPTRPPAALACVLSSPGCARECLTLRSTERVDCR